MTTNASTPGKLLKLWRQRRRLSQLALAAEADISQRHLSFVESGRATPSREMLLHLAEQLGVPLRERNRLLLTAGFAPVFGERGINAPELGAVRSMIERLLESHAPYPALAIDRHWHLLLANRPLEQLLDGIDSKLLKPPVNALRLTLHPAGLASRIRNFREWRVHILERLARQADSTADPALVDLAEELKGYPIPADARPHLAGASSRYGGIVVPLELATPDGHVLSLLSTTTVFGTPLDITLEELAIESFFPADAATQAALQQLAASPG